MTESSSADQGYWVSPFEELARQEDAAWDQTQASRAVPQPFDPMVESPGGGDSTSDGQRSYDGTSAIGTQEYVDPHAAEPGFGGPAGGMLASWYGPGFSGSPTASGEPFDPYGYTAAHPYLPFGTQLLVSYGGNSVLVTVNDRGPFVGGRELDLSEGAAQALGLTQAGVDYVEVSYPGGGGGHGASSSPPAADTASYVPPNAYDANVAINPADGIFAPGGGEEISAPYEGFVPMTDQPEVRNEGLDQVDQTQTYAPNVSPEAFQEPVGPTGPETFQGPYTPTANTYIPAEEPHAPVVGPTFGGPTEGMLASWYGPGFSGSPTASGEPFDPYGYTAAHPYLPFGTQLLVSYGGNSVLVTVNDRGPFVGGRELDLSEGAAQALGLTQAGVDYVEVSYPGGGGGHGASSSPPAADTSSYVPPNAYDANVAINPADGIFAPGGGEEINWEFDNPYDDVLDT